VFVVGRADGVGEDAGSAGLRRVSSLRVEGRGALACDALAVAGGAWSATMGESLGCALPVGPTKGQIVHVGVGEDTGAWPIVQPLLTHYLVPWPGGRVACGGTFESSAGFSTTTNGLLQGPYSGRVVAHAIADRVLPGGEPGVPEAFDPARMR